MPVSRPESCSDGEVTDTDKQDAIRGASGINRISLIPRANLAPVEHPAAAILYLCTAAADDFVGKDLALTDPDFRRRSVSFDRVQQFQ